MEYSILGGGYKLNEAELSKSGSTARFIVLELLTSRNKNLINELFSWINLESIPDEFRSEIKQQELFRYYLESIMRKEVRLDFPFEWFDTPLNNYLILFHDIRKSVRKSVRKEIRESLKARDFPTIYTDNFTEVFERTTSNWDLLCDNPQGKTLCSSLQNWADRNNFNQTWCLDTALYAFYYFVFIILPEVVLPKSTNIDDIELFEILNRFNENAEYAFGLASGDSTQESRLAELEKEALEKLKIKPFIFSRNGINISELWDPLSVSRGEFTEWVKENVQNQIYEQKRLNLDDLSFLIKILNDRLTNYCNSVANKIKNITSQEIIKKSGKHYFWFIDYQFPPTRSFKQIADDNNKDLKSVREALQSVANLIRLPLRPSNKGGRPPGAKDKTKRRSIER